MNLNGDARLADQEIVEQVAPHIYKVCPSASELRAPAQKDVQCPVIDCNKVCKQPSALRFHLERVHKIYRKKQKWEMDKEKPTVEWHCPEPRCMYSMTQKRYFSSRTLLKQHYGKLHLEKTLRCDECGKMFGLEKDLKRHTSNNCTIVYTCTCGSIYMHRESYMMHCSREKHPIKEEYKVKRETQDRSKEKNKIQPKDSISPDNCKSSDKKHSGSQKPENQNIKLKCKNTSKSGNKFKPILPIPNMLILVNVVGEKPDGMCPTPGTVPSQLIYIADARSSHLTNTIDQNLIKSTKINQGCQTKSSCAVQNNRTQTENVSCIKPQEGGVKTPNIISQKEVQPKKPNRWFTSSLTSEGRSAKKRTMKSSTCTQTFSTRHKRIAAQTQTTGDLILRRAMQSANIPMHRESRASQVSPQAKVKRSLDPHSVQSAETQTASRIHSKHRPKRASSRSVSMGTNTPLMNCSKAQDSILAFSTPCPASNMETQTNLLLSEFHSQFSGSSAATQTLESFLLNDVITSSSSQDPASLANTMDQAVLCDLGLMPEFQQSSAVIRNSTATLTEGNRRMSGSCGTCVNYEVTDDDDIKTGLKPNDTVQTLTGIQFDDNSPDLALQHILKTDPALPGGRAKILQDEVTENKSHKFNGAHNFDGDQVNLDYYGTKLYGNSGELNSCTEGATSRPPQLFLQDSLLTASDVNLGVETDIASCLQTDSIAQTNITELSLPELLTSGVQTSNFDAGYMNIETQTVDDISMIDELLNSMETQTSDDFFADFGFSNIETQTQLSLMTVDDDPSPLLGMTTEARQTQTLASSTHQVAGSSVGIQTLFTNSQATLPLVLDIPDQLTTDSVGIQTQSASDVTQQTSSFSIGIQTQQNVDVPAPLMDTETQTRHANMELCPDLSDSYTQTAFDDLVSFVDTLSCI